MLDKTSIMFMVVDFWEMVSRNSNSTFGKWWWTVDRFLLFSFSTMIIMGIILSFAATPMIATKIGLDEFYFLKKHILFIIPSLIMLYTISLLNKREISFLCAIIYVVFLALSLFTVFFGTEIKGAHRWITVFGINVQPSEFLKPSLAVLTAWCFSEQRKFSELNGKSIAFVLYVCVAVVLLLQPDIGMLFIVSSIWLCQLFINGLSIAFVIFIIIAGFLMFFIAYIFLPHVTDRVDRFLSPETSDLYQITKSLEAFSHGGLFGVGPGEGVIKRHLPDAHADFVFSVLGEEFGFFVCAFIVLLTCITVIHGMIKSTKSADLFNMFASVGLLTQLGLQSFVNMASTLHIIPTKGMTLPFMSYGGSSMLAISITVGIILALSRRQSIIYND